MIRYFYVTNYRLEVPNIVDVVSISFIMFMVYFFLLLEGLMCMVCVSYLFTSNC